MTVKVKLKKDAYEQWLHQNVGIIGRDWAEGEFFEANQGKIVEVEEQWIALTSYDVIRLYVERIYNTQLNRQL